MVTALRVLFGVSATVFFFYGGLFIGKWVATHAEENPKPQHLINIAFLANTIALAVFFTLWCVKVGVV